MFPSFSCQTNLFPLISPNTGSFWGQMVFFLLQQFDYIPHAWKVLLTVFCQFYLSSRFPFLDMSSFIFLKSLSESLWCWERMKVEGEGDNRGWDVCMASPTQWTWVWVNSSVGDGQGGLECCSPWGHRVGHDWATEMNWKHLESDIPL